MKAARIACLVVLTSTLVFAQSNPLPLTNKSPVTKNPVLSGLSKPDPAAKGKIVESYGKLPLSFEANQGQTDGRVKFLSRGSGYTLFLTGDEAVFSMRRSEADTSTSAFGNRLHPKAVESALQPKPTAEGGIPSNDLAAEPALSGAAERRKNKAHGVSRGCAAVNDRAPAGRNNNCDPDSAVPATNIVLRMKLRNANLAAKVTGTDELSGKSNYLIGNDPKKWQSNVPTYAKVKYEGVYSGIDLVYYGNQRQLEYDFVVAPGADPRRIQFDVRGAKKISRDKHGDLVLQTSVGEVRWVKPIVYQERDGTRQEIAAHYVIKNRQRIGFEVADYDLRSPLFIDPLVYSTYLGGTGYDNGAGIAVDSAGNAYVTGTTGSTDFPTTPGAFQTICNGGSNCGDAFVTKLNPSGSALVYSTYLGGSGQDGGNRIAVDSSGNAYITGQTTSTDFPTKNPLQPTYGGGNDDAFVAEISPSGSALVYSTYLGGNGGDGGYGIAVDSSGNAYVTGYTTSTDFPTMNPLQQRLRGNSDAFVTKLNTSGSALVYSTYLGGTGDDSGDAVAVDSSGNAYVTGYTASTNFPTKNPLRSYGGGISDAFVTEINPSGSALVYSTYLGGTGQDIGDGIAVDSSGNAYVTGYTASTNFPTKNPLQPANAGNGDAFMTKLNPTGSALVYSTYLGGTGYDSGDAVAVDSSGNAYVTGQTSSIDFPTKNPLQPTSGGGYDAFVAAFNPTGFAFVYSTYLGGSDSDFGYGIAVDSSGNAYVTGYTASTNFPTKNPLQPANAGNGDAFVTQISAAAAPAVTLVPSDLNFGNQTVGMTSYPQISTLTNTGSATLTITSIGVTGANSSDFTENNNCGTSVPAGGSCKISVTFKPSGTGNESASVTITDNAPDSPQSLPLSGVGVLPAVTFSPTSLTFPTQVVFTTSVAQKVTLTNTGLGVLKISAGGISGQFGGTNNCTPTMAPGASCTIDVTFKPRNKGTLNGAISITDNAPGSPQELPLTGTGTYVQLSPTKLSFGNQPINTTSLPKNITLSNKGDTAVNFTGSGITITGANAGDFAQTNNCGASVASGASCFITVTFTPSGQGQRTAAVSISDDGGGSPQAVPLMGTGTP